MLREVYTYIFINGIDQATYQLQLTSNKKEQITKKGKYGNEVRIGYEWKWDGESESHMTNRKRKDNRNVT